ncbi:MAG: hypothetical protein NVS9B14_23000 [Candidatus Acidiferrum sp.]
MKRVLCLGAASFFAAFALATPLLSAQRNPKDAKPLPRTIWNLEGGAFFATDGRIPNGPCFRVTGQATAPGFFDNLKRVDDDSGTHYLRGTEAVTEYPPKLEVSILIHDLPCSFLLKDRTTEPPLTKEDVGKLRLKLYWKRSVALRPTEHFVEGEMRVTPLEPNIKPEADDLAPRYEWHLTFVLPSEGVPIEDSLVVTFQTEGGELAARTSARL